MLSFNILTKTKGNQIMPKTISDLDYSFNKRFEPFHDVCDHIGLFPTYVSLLEKIGDVIWEGYGGGDGGKKNQEIDNERVEFVKDNWHFIEPTLIDVFKTLFNHIEDVEYKGDM